MKIKALYARKEPTGAKWGNGKPCLDTVVYKDRACSKIAYRVPCFYSSHPKRNDSKIIYNCSRLPLVWV